MIVNVVGAGLVPALDTKGAHKGRPYNFDFKSAYLAREFGHKIVLELKKSVLENSFSGKSYEFYVKVYIMKGYEP